MVPVRSVVGRFPLKVVAVITPETLTPSELIVTPDPITTEVNVGVFDNVMVAPIPDAEAVKLSLIKSISRILFAVPTIDPSSLTVMPFIPPPPPPEVLLVVFFNYH